MEILKLRDHKELLDKAAGWFHSKWGIPVEAYRESIRESLENKSSVPQWYVVLEKNEIIGGIGAVSYTHLPLPSPLLPT